MRRRRAFVTAIALLVLAPTLYARGKKAAPTEPGTYNAWGQDIDHIEILKTFKIADYDKIVMQPFDTSATPLPDKSDKSYDTIKSVLDTYTSTLIEAMKPELKAKAGPSKLREKLAALHGKDDRFHLDENCLLGERGCVSAPRTPGAHATGLARPIRW